jgi:hypothetical protein
MAPAPDPVVQIRPYRDGDERDVLQLLQVWHDLRAVTRDIRPDWDPSTPGLREAWDAGDHSPLPARSSEPRCSLLITAAVRGSPRRWDWRCWS